MERQIPLFHSKVDIKNSFIRKDRGTAISKFFLKTSDSGDYIIFIGKHLSGVIKMQMFLSWNRKMDHVCLKGRFQSYHSYKCSARRSCPNWLKAVLTIPTVQKGKGQLKTTTEPLVVNQRECYCCVFKKQRKKKSK